MSPPIGVWAQRAEPPLPNSSGDFTSSQTRGNRGAYEVRHWLVVEPDRNGTHCRSLTTMEPLARLWYGDLLITDTPSQGLRQAVVMRAGAPWLRVRLPGYRLHAVSQRQRGHATCLIRANARFIAPVNGSDLIDIPSTHRPSPSH